jgi:hypothetical protein
MLYFSAQIQCGLLAVEKGFLNQEDLAEFLQQCVANFSQSNSSHLGLAEFLVQFGKITEQQFLDLTAELKPTFMSAQA